MNINRVCFAGNLTAEPEVNYSPQGREVVSASIYSNAFYGCIVFGIGRISYANSASLQVSIMGIMTAITSTAIVVTTKANRTGTTIAPTVPCSMCIFEQMLVSELAVMVQGLPSTSRRRASVKKRMPGDHGKDSSARSIALSNSCGALAY
jgi:hypothetical protein